MHLKLVWSCVGPVLETVTCAAPTPLTAVVTQEDILNFLVKVWYRKCTEHIIPHWRVLYPGNPSFSVHFWYSTGQIFPVQFPVCRTDGMSCTFSVVQFIRDFLHISLCPVISCTLYIYVYCTAHGTYHACIEQWQFWLMNSSSHLKVHLLYAKVRRCSKCFKVKWLVPKYPCWILTRWARLWSGRRQSRRYPPLHLPCCLQWPICLYTPVQPLKKSLTCSLCHGINFTTMTSSSSSMPLSSLYISPGSMTTCHLLRCSSEENTIYPKAATRSWSF